MRMRMRYNVDMEIDYKKIRVGRDGGWWWVTRGETIFWATSLDDIFNELKKYTLPEEVEEEEFWEEDGPQHHWSDRPEYDENGDPSE